jgi:hypothetical protein
VYLDGQRIADDVELEAPLVVTGVALSTIHPLFEITEAAAEDNSNPLGSIEFNLLPNATAPPSDAYGVVLAQDAEGNPISIILPDFQTEAPDPSQASLTVVHAATTAPAVNLTTLIPAGMVADDVAFTEYSPSVTVSPGEVALDVTATDGSAREVYSFDVNKGESYLGILRDETSGKAQQGFTFEVFRADGTTVEAVISTASEDEAAVPATFALHANYPNPFNPQTLIRYALPQRTPVRLAVYDVLGREVAVLVEAEQGAGQYEAVFGADALPSGVYVYRLEAGTFTQTRAMLLVK